MKKGLLLSALLIVGWATMASAGWERMDTLRTYWPNGQLKEQWTEVPDEFNQDGTWWKEGLYRSWYEDGKLSVEMSYHWDSPDGWYRSWYPNGQLKEEGRYTYMKRGIWIRWSEEGYRIHEAYYAGETKVGSELSFRSGPSAQPNGSRYYLDGKLHGMSEWEGRTEFYCHGDLVAVLWADGKRLLPYADPGEYYNDSLDLWVEWEEGWGNVRIGRKVDGKKVGIWTRWPLTGGFVEEEYPVK